MNSRCALVSKIIPFSCVDGPGSRLALFLQGCNLRCKNCHNPWTMGRCNDCGECVPQCPHQALQIVDGKVVWNAVVCEQCDTCLKMCPQHATPMAQSMNVDEVLSHVRKAMLFIEGITVSGGEVTTQLPFVVALFTAIKNDPQLCHLTCLVDSNGMLSETGWEKLLPVCDGAMLDLKAWGSECHQQLTGRDNQQIKRSICLLAERGKLAELRLLVIPGQVDYLQHIEELAALIKGLGDVPVRLNAFHAHGVYGEAQSWPSATSEDVEQLADALRERGVSRLIFPALYL
ncbi:TPA: YjjW family glycine radical enzyme activase [Escherichia coli]